MNDLPITTERITLRHLCENDAEDFASLESDKAVKKHIGGILKKDIEKTKTLISKLKGDIYSPIAITYNQNSQFIGRCGFTNNSVLNDIEINIVIKKEFWGKGIGQETCHLLLRHGYKLGFKKIYAVVSPDNVGSIKMCNKSGMVYYKKMISNDYSNGHNIYCSEQE